MARVDSEVLEYIFTPQQAVLFANVVKLHRKHVARPLQEFLVQEQGHGEPALPPSAKMWLSFANVKMRGFDNDNNIDIRTVRDKVGPGPTAIKNDGNNLVRKELAYFLREFVQSLF
jgi:hypothetical protein